jgi:hypothetical protein
MHSKLTPKIWSAPKVHSKIFGVHLKSTPKKLKCTSSPLQKIWSALKVHSKRKNGVHNIPLQKFHHFGVHNYCPLHFFWSGWLFTPFFWSGRLFTPFFGVDTCSVLFFVGVDTCPLQTVGVHVVKLWSAFRASPTVPEAMRLGLAALDHISQRETHLSTDCLQRTCHMW